MIFIIIGILGILLFLLPFFSYFILNIGNVTGLVVFLIVLLCGIFRQRLFMLITYLWGGMAGKVLLLIIAILIIGTIGLVIAETGCMVRAAIRKPRENATVVVLGCKVKGENPSLMLKERLEAAYSYLAQHPEANCVVSGGQGIDEAISEAECMYRYLIDKGIDSSRLCKEDKSTSTRENLAFSQKKLEEKGWNPSIAIVTNEFHEYRAGKVAEALNIEYGAVPAATAWRLLPTFYVRELYGILYQWIL